MGSQQLMHNYADARKRNATEEEAPPPRPGPVTRSQTRLGAPPAKNPRMAAGTGASGSAGRGGSANSAREGPLRPSPSGAVLAHLRGAYGTLTGSRIEYTAPCSGSNDRPCWLFEDLSLWNEFLCRASLQLREIAGRQSCLILRQVNVSCLPTPAQEDLRHAAAIVHYLLTAHYCVAAVDCSTGSLGTYEYLFFDALRRSKFVRSVKLQIAASSDRDNILCAAISCLDQLKELECSAGKDYPPLLQSALSSFLGKTRSLTALRFPQLRMRTEHAEEFIRALDQNITVRELSLHASIISNASVTYRALFAEYLKNTKAVRALTLVAHNKMEQAAMKWALVGLQTNKSISSVSFVGFVAVRRNVHAVSKIFERDGCLRNFAVSAPEHMLTSITELEASQANLNYDCWRLALSKNKTLEELALPMRVWDLRQWRQFFEALSSTQSLRSVTVEVSSDKHHLFPDVLRAFRESGVGQKVSFKSDLGDDDFDLIRVIGSIDVPVEPRYDRSVSYWRVVRQLTIQNHVECLDLYVHPFAPNEDMFRSIAKGLQAASTLRRLHLRVWSKASDASWATIFKALSHHPSLRELRLEASTVGIKVAGLLGEVVRSSKQLYKVNIVDLGSCQASVFIRALAEDIANCYTLLDLNVKVEDWWPGLEASKAMFAVWDATRRNSDLVQRAVQFAMGTRCDRYCAQALQRMASHPAVFERVALAAKVTEDEAATTVRRVLGSLKGLDQFMQLAGVVREHVECHPCPDGRTQLDDLNEHCWALVSQYLFLDQIKDPFVRPERF